MLGMAIWDKIPKCIFENFEIARVIFKEGNFKIFKNQEGHLSQKSHEPKHVIID